MRQNMFIAQTLNQSKNCFVCDRLEVSYTKVCHSPMCLGKFGRNTTPQYGKGLKWQESKQVLCEDDDTKKF